ncbi:PIR Superfamily Protein [Plasmodium ovale wallikeri]|uniref:PIR Superfamily Protein n=1 Tax=Plasmodium ovale wallikeri TaxID=864142 RepID=A0A1A9AQD8_PLAOA|nr:PIR Superfamily Protein [Plasmodium ovale wallikeri]SBT58321.1 PIR Superfamily Protein [Plasmodium ovale wallikeri]
MLFMDHFDYCEDKLPQELMSYDAFDYFCRKFEFNLDQVKTEGSYTDLDKEPCDALNIRVYDNLFSETKRNKPYERSSFPLEKFLYIWNKMQGKARSLSKKIHSSNGSCSFDFNSYISKSITIYKNLKDKCKENAEPYCKFVQYKKKNYDENELLRLKCTSTNSDSSFRGTGQDLTNFYSPEESWNQDSSAGALDNSNSRVAMSVIFPLFGIVFIFFVFSQHLDHALKVLLMKNKIIRSNMNEGGNNAFFERTYKHEDIGNKYNLRHIGYHTS